MNFKQLELFEKIYELKNLSRAGEALFMTQSAVSQSLKKMEAELNTELFIRTSKMLSPSSAADVLHPYAQSMLTDYNKALSSISALNDELVISFFFMFEGVIINSIVAGLLDTNPELNIKYQRFFSLELSDSENVRDGVLYILPEDCIKDASFSREMIDIFGHVVLVRQDSPLAQKSYIVHEDLRGQTMYVPQKLRFSHLKKSLDMFAEQNIEYNSVESPGFMESVAKITAYGGAAIVPGYLVLPQPNLAIIPFEDEVEIKVVAAYRGKVTPCMQKVLNTLKHKQS